MRTYKQVKENIAKLELEAERLRQREVSKVVDAIKEMMAEYDIKPEDLGFAASGKTKGVRGRKPTAAGARKKPEPKYQDPKTGATWSGMGKPPAWIRDAVAKGKKDQYLIGAAPAAKAKAVTVKPAVKAKNRTAKTVAKVPAKPKAAVKPKAAAKPKASAKPKAVKQVAKAKSPAPKKTAIKKTVKKVIPAPVTAPSPNEAMAA